MKSWFVLAGVIPMLLVSSAASAATKTYTTDLRTDQENVAPDVDGHDPKGTGTFTFNDVTKELCGRITFGDLTGAPTGVHIHQSPPDDPTGDGLNKLLIPPAENPIIFNLKLDKAFELSLVKGELYANVHTAKNTAGEIRSTSPWYLNAGAAPIACPGATPQGDAGAGANDAGSTPDAGTTDTTSGGTSGEPTTTPQEKLPPALSDPAPPAAVEDSGCNTAGAPTGGLSLAILIGVGIAATTRLRRKKR